MDTVMHGLGWTLVGGFFALLGWNLVRWAVRQYWGQR